MGGKTENNVTDAMYEAVILVVEKSQIQQI